MKFRFFNTLTLFILVVVILIASLLLWPGGTDHIDLIAKMIFAPYLLDITRGVGKEAAQYFRWITFATQAVVVVFVIFRYLAKEKPQQALLTIVGIILTIVHFTIVGLGYITTGLH